MIGIFKQEKKYLFHMKAIVHYSEIAIKGRNKEFFEKLLAENIEKAFNKENINVKCSIFENRIVFDITDSRKAKSILEKVFGIQNFAFAEETRTDSEDIIRKAVDIAKKSKKKSIALLTKAGTKKFAANDINKKISDELKKIDVKVDYDNPEEKISIEMTDNGTYFYTEKSNGIGGLPVGSSGKVLVLLSGGIDSAVAAWLMMKRGCEVDYLHFHTFEKNEPVLKTKIMEIVEKLDAGTKLFLIPYYNFQLLTMGAVKEKIDVVVFKNYMLKIAKEIAEKNGYKAIVTGDNLAQVASQTLDNIKATDYGIDLPVFRPLLTYDKQEIIDLAKKIETYEPTIKEYKDCCSIIAKHPDTSVSIAKLKNALNELKIEELVKKSLKLCESFPI